MHYFYKFILALFVGIFYWDATSVNAQCPTTLSTDCNLLRVRIGSPGIDIQNYISGNLSASQCFNNIFYTNSTPVSIVRAKLGDSIYITLPDANQFDSIYFYIRNHGAIGDDIINGDAIAGNSLQPFAFTLDATHLPIGTCYINMKIVAKGVKNCGGVRTEYFGAIYGRLSIMPELMVNNIPLSHTDTTIININSGDSLRMDAINPVNNQTYDWAIGSIHYNYQNPTQVLPVGEHILTVTTRNNCYGLDVTYYAKVIVNNTCGIEYNSTVYNRPYATAFSVNRTLVQGDTLFLNSVGTSTTHNWIAEIYSETGTTPLETRTINTQNYLFLTETLPPCNYIIKFKYIGNNCGGIEYGLNINLKLRPRITANNLPLIAGTSTPIAMCGGTSLVLRGTNSNYFYEWDVPGQSSSTGTSITLANLTFPNNIIGTVSVTTPSNAICRDSSVYTRNINISATSTGGGYFVEYGDTSYVITEPNNVNITICTGDTLKLTSVLDGTYSWNWIGQSSSAKTLEVPQVPAGMYRGSLRVVSNTVGCAGTFNFDFTVNINQSPIDYNMLTSMGTFNTSKSPKELIICDRTPNLSLSINCPNNNCPTDTSGYFWQKIEGGVVTALSPRNATYNIPIVSTIDSVGTAYIVQMKNILGCISKDTVLVKTLPLPTPTVEVSLDSICSGSELTLSVVGIDTTKILSYIWSSTNGTGAAANLQSTNTQSVVAYPENNTENNVVTVGYHLNIIDKNGCAASDSDSVKVKPVWTGRLSSNRITDLCLSDTLVLSAQCSNCSNSNNAITYEWKVRDSSNVLWPLSNTSTDSSIIVSAQQIRGLTDKFLVVLEATKGSCVTTIEGVAYQTIWPNPVVGIDTILHDGLCVNNKITVVASTNSNTPYNYQWVGGIATVRNYEHDYILSVTTPIAFKAFYNPVPQITCETFVETSIAIPSLSTLSINTSKDSICKGDTLNLVSSLNSNIQSYQWFNNTLNDSLGTQEIQSITPLVTTEYRLEVKTNEGCQLSTTKEIKVKYAPVVHLAMPQAPLCAGQDVLISSIVNGGSGRYSYTWQSSGVSLATVNVGTTTITDPSVRKVTIPAASNTATVTLIVKDSTNNLCEGMSSIPIKEASCGTAIRITRSLNKEKYCETDSVAFIAEAMDATIANPIFYWSTGRIRESVENNRFDTLVVRGNMALPDTLSVIITNGSPDFKVKEVASNNVVIGINEDNTANFSANNGNPLTLHPSLYGDSTNNDLYKKSIVEIVIYKNITGRLPTNTDIEPLSGILFDNKYAGKIISQLPSTDRDTAFRTLRVQVPCMIANSAIPIILVTSTGQIKRIPNCVLIQSHIPANNLASQALQTVRVENPTIPANDTLHTAVVGMRDSVYIQIEKIENEFTRVEIEPIEVKVIIDKRNHASYDNNREYKIRFLDAANAVIHESNFPNHNLKNHEINYTYTLNTLQENDFPIWVQLQQKDGTSWSPIDITSSQDNSNNDDALEIDDVNATAYISTYAIWGIDTAVYNVSTGANTKIHIKDNTTLHPLNFVPVVETKGTKRAYKIEFPATITLPSVDPTLTVATDTIVVINNVRIKYTNSGEAGIDTTFNLILEENKPYIGTTSEGIAGPIVISHMSYSDYLFHHSIDTFYYPGTALSPMDSIKNILIPSSLTGKLGHVCLFDMGLEDYVYISPNNKVIEGKGTGVNANTREQEFVFAIDRPKIDSVVATLDTVCSEQLTVLRAHTPVIPNSTITSPSSSFTWRSNPTASIDVALLSSMNLDSIYIRPKRTAQYIVELTSRYGCKVKDSILITVNSLPYSNIIASHMDTSAHTKISRFCPTSSTTLFAQADSINCANNCTYNWEVLNNNLEWVNISNTNNINRNTEETVRLSITNNGCFDYDTIQLVQYDMAPVAIQGDSIKRYMCNGIPITLNVDSLENGASYTWSTGTSGSSLVVGHVGGYTVEKIDSNGCAVMSTPVLVVNSTRGTNRSVTGNPSVICGNNLAQLSVEACVDCQYTWYRVQGTTDIVVQTRSLNRHYSTSVTGTYYAEITNNEGCTFKSNNSITVDALNIASPTIVASAYNLCNNSVITITAPSVPTYQYQWYRNGIVLSAHTASSITVSTPGLYYVKVTANGQCSASSNTVDIKQSTFNPVLDPSESIICDGSYLTLSTPIVVGSTYQWYLNGVPLANSANASTYNATVAGNYYVRVTNSDGCAANTNTRTLNVSSLNTPVASADITQFCPGEEVRLSVTLCPGCQYQWARNGINIDSVPSANNYVKYVSQVGDYTVRVYDQHNTCNIASNTVTLTQHNAPIPAIVSRISEICNNIFPELETNACAGCTYTWLQDIHNPNLANPFQPIFNSANDIRYQVTEGGNYKVRVQYNNGCEIESNTLTIADGSFATSLTLSSDAGFSTQICNGSPIRLVATISDASRCNGNCTYYWFRDGALMNSTPLPTYDPSPAERLGGDYLVRVETSAGCISESPRINVPAVTLSPIITASATALCGTTPVVLTVNNCVGDCNDASILWSTGDTTRSIVVDQQRSYTATVTLYSHLSSYLCHATTAPIALNSLQDLGMEIAFAHTATTVTTSSICAGTSVEMISLSNCTTCTYQWVKDTLQNPTTPVLTATLPQHTTNVPGRYALIAVDPLNNCRDTSNYLVLNKVDRDTAFRLSFGTNNILAATGSAVNLDVLGDGLHPNNLHTEGRYTSTALFASTVTQPGLSNAPRNNIFSPSSAVPGNYLIEYTYTTQGCDFTASDVISIKDAAGVTIDNTNPSHVSYEACVTDTIIINTTNYAFRVENVFLRNQTDAYQALPIYATTVQTESLGTDNVYHQRIELVIPDWAKGSFIQLEGIRSNGQRESAVTPYLMIHNEPLAITGLPQILCSNGNQLALSGTPLGGQFFMYPSTAVDITTSGFPGVFNGNILNPRNIPTASTNADGVMDVTILYRSYSKFTNGANCPQPDTTTATVEFRAVPLTSVTFHPISISQEREELKRLVDRVMPYTSAPSRWLENSVTNGHQISFAGAYTTPAGSPTHFLPADAGLGAHILHYKVHNNICVNSANALLTVLPAPAAIAIADTICRNMNPIDFTRDNIVYPYRAPVRTALSTSAHYRDTSFVMRVTTAAGSRYLSVTNPNAGTEEYAYWPNDLNPNPLQHDTLLIEYIFTRSEYNTPSPNNNVLFDSTSYVVASFKKPIFIEDTATVVITGISPVLCENNVDVLLGGTPSGGSFTLQGGTGDYATESILRNQILNTYAIHNRETSNTNYVLTYNFNGVACRSRDTLHFMIPNPLDAAFMIPNNRHEYCHSDAPVTISPVAQNAQTATLLVNGIAQQSLTFAPSLTQPGSQRLELRLTDAYGCITNAVDSVWVNALPQLDMRGFNANLYCTNDEQFAFTISPAPSCTNAVGGEIMVQHFNSGILPANWLTNNINSATSTGWGHVSPYLTTDGVIMIDTTRFAQNAWIFTQGVPVTAGKTYQFEYLMRVGDNCNNCDPAAMEVRVGPSASVGAQSTLLSTYPSMDNNYSGFFRWYRHSWVAPATGIFNFSFHAMGVPTAANRVVRSIAIDQVIVKEITPTNCATGIGALSGAGIIATANNDSIYNFAPSTAPGVNRILYQFTDANGCSDSLIKEITVFQHTPVSMTNLDPTYCWNEQAVALSANEPGGVFSIRRLDNNTGSNMQLNNAAITSVTYNTSVPVLFLPHIPGAEELTYTYRDPLTQCVSIVKDTVQVVSITDSLYFLTRDYTPSDPNALDSVYCENALPALLFIDAARSNQNITNGTFYGAGVVNGANGSGQASFDPSLAKTAMGRVGNDTLSYVFITSNGCLDTITQIVRVEERPTLSFDHASVNNRLPDSICISTDSMGILVRHTQWTGVHGDIFIDSLLSAATGLMESVPLPNRIIGGTIFIPAVFGVGTHTIEYSYTNIHGCSNSVRKDVRVDSIPVISFDQLPADRIFCENEDGNFIHAEPSYYPGSGYLAINNARVNSSSVYIDPQTLANDPNAPVFEVYYVYTSREGCTAEARDTFRVYQYPRIDISNLPTTFCSGTGMEDLLQYVQPQTGIFTDNLAVPSIVNNHFLDLAGAVGPRRVHYHVLDPLTTCYNVDSTTVTLYTVSVPNFDIFGGCQQDSVFFEGDMALDALFDRITQVKWSMGNGQEQILAGDPNNPTTVPSYAYVYPNHGVYVPTLTVYNNGICSTSVSKEWIVSQRIAIDGQNAQPYFENFENGTTTGWYAQDEEMIIGAQSIWSNQLLAHHHIQDPSNTAWVTFGRPDDTLGYSSNIRSYLYTPCFDMTETWKPMISLDLWTDFVESLDGAVLEYYDETTRTWKALGSHNPYQGINWYNVDFLASSPGAYMLSGARPQGWSSTSGDWFNSRYRLDQFAGQSNVRFRLAFASGVSVLPFTKSQGIAIDNFWIGERTRNVLVEHFSTVDYPNIHIIDQIVYDMVFDTTRGFVKDVNFVQYHLKSNGFGQETRDSMYAQAPFPNGLRAAFYSHTNTANMFRVNGFKKADKSENIAAHHLDEEILTTPKYIIHTPTIAPDVNDPSRSVISVKVLGQVSETIDNVFLHLLLTEDDVPGQANMHVLKGVVRDLYQQLEMPADNWYGRSDSFSYNVSLHRDSIHYLDYTKLNIVAFIQNAITGEVYQSRSNRDLSVYGYAPNPVGVTIPIVDETSTLKLYPNPTTQLFNVSFSKALETEHDWMLVDVLGRVLQTGKAPIGTENMQVQTEDLPSGTYIFVIKNESVYTQRQVTVVRP